MPYFELFFIKVVAVMLDLEYKDAKVFATHEDVIERSNLILQKEQRVFGFQSKHITPILCAFMFKHFTEEVYNDIYEIKIPRKKIRAQDMAEKLVCTTNFLDINTYNADAVHVDQFRKKLFAWLEAYEERWVKKLPVMLGNEAVIVSEKSDTGTFIKVTNAAKVGEVQMVLTIHKPFVNMLQYLLLCNPNAKRP